MFEMLKPTANGWEGTGPVSNRLLELSDPGYKRPFFDEHGRPCVTVNMNGVPTTIPYTNADTALRYDDWKHFDTQLVKVARPRLKVVGDLTAAGLTYNIPDGMGSTVLHTETQSDGTAASVSMDGISQSDNDRPHYSPVLLPLPIIHKDFHFTLREIAASRKSGTPLDTSSMETATRKVAEEMEKLHLGVSSVADLFAYGGGTIYGLTDFPDRLTKTMTAPTASGWTGTTFLSEILAMRKQSTDAYFYGPWMMYVSPAWDAYLDADFKTNSDRSLRERVKMVDGINDIRTLDYLTGYTVLLVQMTSDVIRTVNGLNITTMQWDSDGGMRVNFKVMAISVPQIRSDYNGNTGLVHGTTA